MPSPFPGMDPWLESPGVFPDLHNAFITFLRGELNRRLPAPFFAAIATRIYMEESERRTEPDVNLLSPANGVPIGVGGTAVATRAHAQGFEIPALPWPDEEITETSVEIRTSQDDERLITNIEILSPTNKTRGSSGRGLYLAKQHEMRAAGVNLVEIDFLRTGVHATAAPLAETRRRAGPYDYHVCSTRADRGDAFFVVPIRLHDPLPTIDVPLTPEAGFVAADLQATFDRCYDEALYSRRVHYERPCEPLLSDSLRLWAEGILQTKGRLHGGDAG
jgi:Protein of unknown function (DUF4058)